jgi:hypothetical protein
MNFPLTKDILKEAYPYGFKKVTLMDFIKKKYKKQSIISLI